jgi:hypothetical protein
LQPVETTGLPLSIGTLATAVKVVKTFLRFDFTYRNPYHNLDTMKKPLIVIVLAAVCVTAIIIGRVVRRSQPLNVLVISLDTVRPDHLACYGYTDIETPNIDSLAEGGILFEDALTSCPMTLPSHASVLTGLYPITHGIRDNGAFVLRDRFTTLTEILKSRGYSTGAFIASFVLDSRFGLCNKAG